MTGERLRGWSCAAGPLGLLVVAIALACGGSHEADDSGNGGSAVVTLTVTGPGRVDLDAAGGATPATCRGDRQCTISAAPGVTVTLHAFPDDGAKFGSPQLQMGSLS